MVTYDQLATAVVVLVAFFTFVILVWNFIKALKEMNKPYTDLKKKVDDHDEQLRKGDVRMDDQDQVNNLTLKCLLQVMNHLAYGDHQEELIARIDEVQGFLIERR